MKRIAREVLRKAARIKLLLLDVDGVLTDGGIYIDDRGVETKRFDVRDGQGIKSLMETGVRVGLITSRSSNVVRRRARELGVGIVHQGVVHKLDVYDRIKAKLDLSDEEIAYAGDDIADTAILERAGLAIAVADAMGTAKASAHYVTDRNGGNGAVREICELIINARIRQDKVV